jgi:hypothetical protein
MRRLSLFALLLALAAFNASAGVKITILNTDNAGIGFNDATPVQPIGGNPGTTLGAQRLNAFNYAASLWGQILDSSVPVVISATFSPINSSSQPCTLTSAILGAAGATQFVANFTGAPQQNVAYPVALADKLAGKELLATGRVAHITARFNSLVDNVTCLGTSNWYYGFDGNHGKDIDLVAVLLHEFGHGLGFAGNINTDSGTFSGNIPSIFEVNTYDNKAGQTWMQMDANGRLSSMTNTGHLAWNGAKVTSHARTLLKPSPVVTINAPAPIAKNYDIGLASFGAPINATAITANVVAAADAADAAGALTTDACSAITNASAIAGKWALVDRGNCEFVLKATNVQAAGALGMIIADNAKTTCFPPGMGGGTTADPALITIPVISLTQDDGAAVRAQLPSATVNVTAHTDSTSLAGATQEGFAKLYAPCTFEPGSSIYHFDVTAFPNLLMEPAISDDVTHTGDLTVDFMQDIGWTLTPQAGGRTILRRR